MHDNYEYSATNIRTHNKDIILTSSLHKLLDKLAKKGCLEMVFSRFPYYNTKLQCKRLAIQSQEGNCVAFSYHMKHLLKKHKLKSFIVGAKVPPKFSRPGYKDINHTSVVFPFANGIALFDTAFYFHKAIILNTQNNYENCYTFKNVYTKSNDVWCFKVVDDKITVNINGFDVDAYYNIKELTNPYKSITIHTNEADKTVFRCEVDKNFISKFYYKINLKNNILSVNSTTQNHTNIDLNSFLNTTQQVKTQKLKTWIQSLKLSKYQKTKMYIDIFSFIKLNKLT